MQCVRTITLVLTVGFAAQQFCALAKGQELASRPTVGRGIGRREAKQPVTTPEEFQKADGNSPEALTPAAPESGRVGGAGDPTIVRDRHPLYRLRSGDALDIHFTFSPDLDQSTSVGPDGYVSLKGTHGIHAQGRSVPELERDIAEAYSGILKDPQVTVTLRDFEKPYFLALGEFSRPGKYELRSDLTLSEAMAVAGGFTQNAKHSQVVLFRRVSEDLFESRVVNVKKLLSRRDLQEDVRLQPGDLVYIPQSFVSKIQRFMPATTMGMYLNALQF